MTPTPKHTVTGVDASGNNVYREVVSVVSLTGDSIGGGSGGGGASLSDLILTDTSGTYFIARDDGSALTYITLSGAAYTPVGAVSPADKALTNYALETGGNLAASATSLSSIDANIGAAGVTPPAITGTGVIGWLRGAFEKLEAIRAAIVGGVAVTGTFWQATQPVSAADLPLPTGAATESTIAAINAKLPTSLGAQDPSGSLSVVFNNDLTVNGPAGLSVLNTDLITGTVNGWFDAQDFHSASIQIFTTVGTTGGQIIFEHTNDATLSSGNVLFAYETLTANPLNALFTVGGGVTRMFNVSIMSRYVRVRITTAFAGGTIRAACVFSQLPFANPSLTAQQATAGSLQMTATMASSQVINSAIPTVAIDLAYAAITATGNTATFNPALGVSYEINIPVTVVTGTLPTLDVGIEESDDGGTNWFRVYDFPRITEVGSYRSPKLPASGNKIRYVQTLSGTTPSFTRAYNRLQFNDAAPLQRQIVDRAIAPNTQDSTTARTLKTGGASNVQIVVNMGAITTTAPAIQIEGSDDFGVTWYPIGTPLTGIANKTVQASYSMQTDTLRARVSTAGVGATLGYVIVKASALPMVPADQITPVSEKAGSGAMRYLSDTTALAAVSYSYIQVITDTVFATLTNGNSTAGSIATLTIPAGTVLRGTFTALQLTSGAVALYV